MAFQTGSIKGQKGRKGRGGIAARIVVELLKLEADSEKAVFVPLTDYPNAKNGADSLGGTLYHTGKENSMAVSVYAGAQNPDRVIDEPTEKSDKARTAAGITGYWVQRRGPLAQWATKKAATK